MQAVRRVSVKNVRLMSTKAVLPDLNYDYNELEPIVSAKIMELHHGKHHATYVNNYNSLTEQYAEAQAKNDVQKMIALQQEDLKMSCGFSPEMAAMLAQMSKEKEKSANNASAEYLSQQDQVKKAQQRYESVQAKQATDSGYDWTRPYEKWEAWEDPDELAEKEQQAREKAEHAAMQQACNHDHSAERKLMEMSTAEKMLQCDHFRLIGNQFFTHAQYQRAAYHYHRALIYFEYMFSDTDEEQQKMDDLKKKILVNFALCRLKTRHLDQAIHNATLALKLDNSNIKAMYIKAVAYRMQDQFDLAQKELDQAIQLAPQDASLTQELRVLTIKKAAYRVKSKQLSAAMFQQSSLPISAPSSISMRDIDLQRALDVNLRSLTTPTESIESWHPSKRGIKAMEDLVMQLSGNDQDDALLLI
ncbi:hypothetical protein THRCLA_01815 [Thraustotheca clavata]|uniref:superoxide dismutase n=1 Tax=Thraustotheca clavata TaxID=74557 RepID=A0A1W0A771_9STRA|nr:hypothetical protein THRCLA_01815 [Thraustotheca clavata]